MAFIKIDRGTHTDFLPCNDVAELEAACRQLVAAGIVSAPVYAGDPEGDNHPNGRTLWADARPGCLHCGVELDADGNCPQCSIARKTLPSGGARPVRWDETPLDRYTGAAGELAAARARYTMLGANVYRHDDHEWRQAETALRIATDNELQALIDLVHAHD